MWFNPRALSSYVSNAVLDRGLGLFRAQKVLELDLHAIDKGRWQLNGVVQGSERLPYLQHIRLHLDAQGQLSHWDSDCTCPVGPDCKHAVALTLKAAYQNNAVATAPPQPPSAEELATRRQAEETRIQMAALMATGQWLQRFDVLASASGARTASDQSTAETLVYVLGLDTTTPPSGLLRLLVQKAGRKKNGEWAKPKHITTAPYPAQPLIENAVAQDRELVRFVRGLGAGAYSYGYATQIGAVLAGEAGLIALKLAAATGRLFATGDGGALGPALHWAEPLDIDWQWRDAPPAGADNFPEPTWVLQARLAGSPTARLYPNDPPLYLDPVRGLCGLAHTRDVPSAHLALLLNAPPLRQSSLKSLQLSLQRHLGGVALPPSLQPLDTVRDVMPTAHLHITPVAHDKEASLGLLQAHLTLDYAGLRGRWDDLDDTAFVQRGDTTVLLHRNLSEERAVTQLLHSVGLSGSPEAGYFIAPPRSQQSWLHWAEEDFASFRTNRFHVTLDESLTDWLRHADALDVQMQPGDPADPDTSPWFDLSLGMEIDGQRHNILPWLPNLLAQLAEAPVDEATGERVLPQHVFLRQPGDDNRGGNFFCVSTEPLRPWLAALLELVGDRDLDGDSLRLTRLEALRAGTALGAGAVWSGAHSLLAVVAQLGGRSALPEVAPPPSLQAVLRPYQQQGLNWLQFLRRAGLSGILADDMGLGKTLQTLAHIQVEKDAGRLTQPALIIAPVSLLGNWQREAQRFCPGLRVLVIHGADRHAVARTTHDHDVVIAPYSLLQRDRQGWLDAAWHLVVLDEAQNIKNASTHAAQVVAELDTRHRMALSGTPMENHLGELWSLFHYLMPGFLGSQARFKQLFRTPIEKQGDHERLVQLRSRITPFMLRRTKALVAHELPPKVETVMRVELQGKQADLYETIRLTTEKAVREALDGKGLAKSHITILDALLKLRQVCCDPQLLKLASAQNVRQSAKMDQLMDILPEMLAEGRRVLLFSQFTTMLARIEAELKARAIPWVKLTGQSQKRDEIIERFTSGAVPLFLISLKAGGVGLNLPQADTVIHFDPWWNPAVENQATDRAHRIGQTHSVWVVKLVAQGTIEERILALQERKAALAESIYSGAQGRKEPLFSEKDLQELLQPLSS